MLKQKKRGSASLIFAIKIFAGVCTNCRKELVQKMVTASTEMEQEESTKCNVSGDNKE